MMTSANAGPIEVIGHGGAGDFFPGNSEQSILKAIALGVDRIEVDVLQTASGDLVLVHDAKLRIVSGPKRPVSDLTTSQVRAHVDDLLTLDQFFELVGPRQPLLLDLKSPGYEREVVNAIEHYGPGRDVWISTSHAHSILTIHRLAPRVKLGLSSGHIANALSSPLLRPILSRVVRALMPAPLILTAKICGAQMIMVNFRACSPGLVRTAHGAHLTVVCWTVNRPANIATIADMGVDAIISNRPDLVREIVSPVNAKASIERASASC